MLTEGERARFWPKVDIGGNEECWPSTVPRQLCLWPKVDKRGADECWPWTGARHPRGYGSLGREDGRMVYAHRLMWEAMHGEIPAGRCVLHACDNPPCVNPLHLFLGTHGDNARDKERKGRGLHPRGEQHWYAKLTREQVLEIRARVAQGQAPTVLGRLFGVHCSTVSRAAHRQTWAWLEEGGACG